jgi:predicted  nucleic acid-binding Zn-ribbon protein
MLQEREMTHDLVTRLRNLDRLVDKWRRAALKLEDEIERLQARIAELETFLKAFAFEAAEWKSYPDDYEVDILGVELGNIRAARRAGQFYSRAKEGAE